jgi:hypothetical protein
MPLGKLVYFESDCNPTVIMAGKVIAISNRNPCVYRVQSDDQQVIYRRQLDCFFTMVDAILNAISWRQRWIERLSKSTDYHTYKKARDIQIVQIRREIDALSRKIPLAQKLLT